MLKKKPQEPINLATDRSWGLLSYYGACFLPYTPNKGYDGATIIFKSVIEYVVWHKSTDPRHRRLMEMNSNSANTKFWSSNDVMKKNGFSIIKEWKELRIKLLEQALAIKYSPSINPLHCHLLLSTKTCPLIYNSPDPIFGTGKKGKGQNLLGKLTEKHRKVLASDANVPKFEIKSIHFVPVDSRFKTADVG